ncbi:class I SAM-dependent methyltransferase [Chitinimonas lacunae]|uniref:Class I SAM-dependent methyltransferase n=1 Tax=Chitinimonas lacunae TaxID=1963018 RepID=A0ABV8MS97_9NEIS
MPTLPAPDADQQAASEALSARLHARLAETGWLSFADFMREALYAPGLGYYSGGSRKFGAAGDFVTAPELSPLFGAAMARPLAQVLDEIGGSILEAGAGTGRLALDILSELDRLGRLPERYLILELSAELAERQRQTLAQRPDLLARVAWLDRLPQRLVGAVIGNEVLDAMPCRLLRQRQGQWQERGVVAAGQGFAWEDRPLHEPELAAQLPPGDYPEGYTTEVQSEAQGFVASLFEVVERGALLLLDYGFPAAEFYHPQRHGGTLMCHYRHHAHDDPLFWPGLQDITCHIDFSAIWRAATLAGWRLEGYTSQASFLLDAGLLELLARHDPADARHYAPVAAAVQRLLSPAEMGELFKAIGFSKDMQLDGLLAGFRRDDRSAAL